jgi:hypothetical protein
MWVEAMKRNLGGPPIISENDHIMAELQAERERACECNRPRSLGSGSDTKRHRRAAVGLHQ